MSDNDDESDSGTSKGTRSDGESDSGNPNNPHSINLSDELKEYFPRSFSLVDVNSDVADTIMFGLNGQFVPPYILREEDVFKVVDASSTERGEKKLHVRLVAAFLLRFLLRVGH